MISRPRRAGTRSRVQLARLVAIATVTTSIASTTIHTSAIAQPDCKDYSVGFPKYRGSVGYMGLGINVHGDVAYVTSRAGLLGIYDLSTPGEPIRVGTVHTGLYDPIELTVEGDLAYVADRWGGLKVMDVSDPLAPSVIGQERSFFGGDVAVAGTLALLTDYELDELYVIDVTDPTAPVRLSQLAIGSDVSDVAGLALETGGLGFVAADSQVVIVDLDDPLNPHVAAGIALENPRAVTIVDGLLYVGDLTRGLFVFDVSDPVAPSQIAHAPTARGARKFQRAGTSLYSAAGAFVIVDVSDPAAPVHIVTLDTNQYGAGIGVANGVGYATEGVEGYAAAYDVDYTEPLAPIVEIPLDGIPKSIVVDGDRALIGTSREGVEVLDVSDPLSPTSLGRFDATTFGLALRGDVAYAVTSRDSLMTVDLTDPGVPVVTDTRRVPYDPRELALTGDWLCVATRDQGLAVYDVSDPTHPRLSSSALASERVTNVIAEGDRAWIVGRSLAQLDLSDIGSVGVRVNWDIDVGGVGLAKVEDRIYVTSGAGIAVVDVSTTPPVVLTRTQTLTESAQIVVVDDYAFLTEGGTFSVVDLLGSEPTLLGQSLAAATDIVRIGDYIVSVGSGAMDVFAPPCARNTPIDGGGDGEVPLSVAPGRLRLVGWPNPFAASTRLTFTLPDDAAVSLRVFDPCGRVVHARMLGPLDAGIHEIAFDARDEAGAPLTSGVWFARIDAGTRSQTTKLIVAR